jgi:hypothetical protein
VFSPSLLLMLVESISTVTLLGELMSVSTAVMAAPIAPSMPAAPGRLVIEES